MVLPSLYITVVLFRWLCSQLLVMRLTLCCSDLSQTHDQMQQGLVDAASKALSYRQDVLEENIRLTYAVQVSHWKILTHLGLMLSSSLYQQDLLPSISGPFVLFDLELCKNLYWRIIQLSMAVGRAGEEHICSVTDATVVWVWPATTSLRCSLHG